MSIGRWLGVEVRVHPGWVLVVALVVSSPARARCALVRHNREGCLRTCRVVSLLPLAGRCSCPCSPTSWRMRSWPDGWGRTVPEIWLTVLGGIAWATPSPRSARTEALIALAGPIASVTLGVAVALPALLLPAEGALWVRSLWWTLFLIGRETWCWGWSASSRRCRWTAAALVRALLWGVTRDQVRATRLTGAMGRLLAYA